MKIVDENSMTTALSFDTVVDTIGIVLGDRDNTDDNSLKLYIPKLMLGIDLSSGKGEPVEVEANIDIDIENSDNLNIGSNFITLTNYIKVPPLMIPGVALPRFRPSEIVRITFADSDIKSPTYFPFSLGNESLKRKVDIMRYSVPAKENFDDPISSVNSYFVEINSRDFFFRIHTSDKNGEMCPFTFNMNTKDGIVTFMDNTERKFEWNYNEDKMLFQTDAGARTTWCKTDITHECETYNVFASDYVNIETSKYKLKSDQGDFLVDNMYTENTSHEHKATSAKQEFDNAELSGNLWQIISPGLFLDSPMTVHTGVNVMAGFIITKMSAPGKTPSIYSGGAIDGASIGASTSVTQPQVPSNAPNSMAAGSSSVTDMKGVSGQPVAYALPTIAALTAVAKVADQAYGLALLHGHPGEYKPLAPGPFPSAPKPGSTNINIATLGVSGLSNAITASTFKA